MVVMVLKENRDREIKRRWCVVVSKKIQHAVIKSVFDADVSRKVYLQIKSSFFVKVPYKTIHN